MGYSVLAVIANNAINGYSNARANFTQGVKNDFLWRFWSYMDGFQCGIIHLARKIFQMKANPAAVCTKKGRI
jgi:hypothetical protein